MPKVLFRVSYSGADQERSLWYHGTSIDKLDSILHEGMNPNADKAWHDSEDGSINLPSRQSYGGIYVTQNFLTAYGSARRGSARNKDPREKSILMVILDLQPRSFAMDEDEAHRYVNEPIGHLTSNDFWIAMYYMALKFGSQIQSDYDRGKWSESLRSEQKDMISRGMEKIKVNFGKELHPDFERRIKHILGNCWEASLQRRAYHVFKSSQRWEEVWTRLTGRPIKDAPENPLLNNRAEDVYMTRLDLLTKTLKSLARPLISQDTFNATARLLQPVGFSGSNRIVCLLEMIEMEDRGLGLKEHYGHIPQEFIKKMEDTWTKNWTRL